VDEDEDDEEVDVLDPAGGCWLVGRIAAVRLFCTEIGRMLAKGVSPPRQGVTVADCCTVAEPDIGFTLAVRGELSEILPFSATELVEGLVDC